MREPEALFWSFGFPILLAIGWASRFAASRRTSFTSRSSTARRRRRRSPSRCGATARSRSNTLPPDSAACGAAHRARGARRRADRRSAPSQYEYDDTRPDARTARLMVNDAVQRGAGRADPLPSTRAPRSRARLALHRLRRAGSARHDDHGRRHLGTRASRSSTSGGKNLLKRLVATPMSRAEYLASYVISRLVLLTIEVVVLLGFVGACCSACRCAARWSRWPRSSSSPRWRSADWVC